MNECKSRRSNKNEIATESHFVCSFFLSASIPLVLYIHVIMLHLNHELIKNFTMGKSSALKSSSFLCLYVFTVNTPVGSHFGTNEQTVVCIPNAFGYSDKIDSDIRLI